MLTGLCSHLQGDHPSQTGRERNGTSDLQQITVTRKTHFLQRALLATCRYCKYISVSSSWEFVAEQKNVMAMSRVNMSIHYLSIVTTHLLCNGMARTVSNITCVIRICVIYPLTWICLHDMECLLMYTLAEFTHGSRSANRV